MLLPLLAGLFVVEQRAPLPAGGHTAVQVGIVLFIYGVVWLWLRANTLQLLWSAQDASDRKRVIEAHGAPIRVPRIRSAPRQAHFVARRARHPHRRGNPEAQRRRMRTCSVNFDQRSSW